jgi:hypothetical protein
MISALKDLDGNLAIGGPVDSEQKACQSGAFWRARHPALNGCGQ